MHSSEAYLANLGVYKKRSCILKCLYVPLWSMEASMKGSLNTLTESGQWWKKMVKHCNCWWNWGERHLGDADSNEAFILSWTVVHIFKLFTTLSDKRKRRKKNTLEFPFLWFRISADRLLPEFAQFLRYWKWEVERIWGGLLAEVLFNSSWKRIPSTRDRPNWWHVQNQCCSWGM